MLNSSTIERNEFEELANAMGQNNKSAYNKRVLSKHKGQVEYQNNINPKLHGICNISYLHRFKIIESPGWSQTVDHLSFDCTILQDVRE